MLRVEITRRLASLKDSEVAICSQKITEQLISSIDWPTVQAVHIYRSHSEWHEADTTELIKWMKTAHPHIEITIAPSGCYAALPRGRFGLIIVPLVGFDGGLHRLGRGAGWYDRFLARQPDARKVGLGFESCKVDGLPVETHDVPLDMVVTEQAVYRGENRV